MASVKTQASVRPAAAHRGRIQLRRAAMASYDYRQPKVRFATATRRLLAGIEEGVFDPGAVIAAILALPGYVATRFNDSLENSKGNRSTRGLTSRFSSVLYEAAANHDEIDALANALSALEPTPKKGRSNGWFTPRNIGFATMDATDVNQGMLGDCWLLSALGAQAAADPSVLKKHIRVNPNGSCTVALFRKGNLTAVTVSTRLPSLGQGRVAFAGGGSEGKTPNWVSIFEKAAAQLIGGGRYARIENGIGSTGISVVSGPDASTYGPRIMPKQTLLSLGQIKGMVEQGRPIVPMTAFSFRDSTISDRHAYYVVGISEYGRIIVRNPWGTRGRESIATTMFLTERQFNRKFFTAGVGD